MTTPLERQILTHYWLYDKQYDGPDSCVAKKFIRVMVARGILREGRDGIIYGNRDALEPYMKALEAIPLPINEWYVPAPPTFGPGEFPCAPT